METVLVPSHQTYAYDGSAEITNGDEINTIEDGGFAFITETGLVVPSTGFTTETDKYIRMIVKTSQGILSSPLMQRSTFNSVKTAYVAPVAKVQTLTFNSSSLTVGKTATVQITPFKDLNGITRPVEVHSLPVTTGLTMTALVALLVIKINANSTICTATSSTNVLTLTGAVTSLSFNATGGNELIDYTPAITTQFVNGKGTAAQVLKLETEASAHKGNMRSQSFGIEMFPQAMQTVAGNYITYDIGWTLTKGDALNSNGAPYNQKATIACITGGALIAVLDAVIATI